MKLNAKIFAYENCSYLELSVLRVSNNSEVHDVKAVDRWLHGTTLHCLYWAWAEGFQKHPPIARGHEQQLVIYMTESHFWLSMLYLAQKIFSVCMEKNKQPSTALLLLKMSLRKYFKKILEEFHPRFLNIAIHVKNLRSTMYL